MENRKIILVLLATISFTYAEVQLITKPEPGQEYVFLQTSAAGSRPVERKEKPSENERIFETAHKLPPSVTYALNQAENEESVKAPSKITKPKRETLPADAAAPAPAGAIKLDVQKLLEQYKTDLKTSTTTKKPSISTKSSGARSSKRTGRLDNRRTKKEAQLEESPIATTSASILTTSAAGLKPLERDDDNPLLASGSEKQRSRIQIKKGPNGQEYEYEYVYYYYDDDDTVGKKDSKQPNAHDGPTRNEITPQQSSSSRSRGSSGATPEQAVNEVLPTSRSNSRGRQLEDEVITEERLPANTRFPPRSRNLNTTPSSGEEPIEETKPSRSRGRGRPETSQASVSSSETDNVSDETQGSRGRTRANVRRPSLELVDSASFNTHTSSGEPPNGSGPSFPSDLPAGPVRFLGATPNERIDIPADKKEITPSEEVSTDDVANKEEATTMMSAMDKVALDLYAILQGTQRLTGEQDVEGNTEVNTEMELETTTLEATTEMPTTEATTPSTTTVTTTTTTPAPSSSAPESSFGRGKYRTRPGIGGRKSIGPQSTTTTTESPAQESSKPKSRFGRPSFGSRPRVRTTVTPNENAEQTEQKEDAKTLGSTRTRSRFGAGRTKVTTVTPEGTSESNSSPSSRPSLRPRPTFNLRGRTRPTPATGARETAVTEESHDSSTTARSRPRINASNVRPLRPGPRINLTGGRGRLGATTPAAEIPSEPAPVVEDDQEKTNIEESPEKETETTPAPDTNPLSRLRNRQRSPLQVRQPTPKAAASAPVQVRRINPLLSRRKPIGEASSTETPASHETPATEASSSGDVDEDATDSAPISTPTTTEEPKGLNKLLAGRRRLTLRQPGTIA